MERAEVVAEMVLPEERVGVPAAPLVVALELGLLLVREVHDPDVPVEVRLPAGALVTPAVRASEPLLAGVCRGSGGGWVSGTGTAAGNRVLRMGQPNLRDWRRVVAVLVDRLGVI